MEGKEGTSVKRDINSTKPLKEGAAILKFPQPRIKFFNGKFTVGTVEV